ncbi:hypothetical protein Tco_0559529 [Tanacetum coccineum]
MSDMTTCLNDLSYIPPNNEQNEPTQGDIGETSNKPTQAIHNEFEELYASANEELYPGCDHGEDHKDKQFCLVCNTSRWKDSNTPWKKVSKKMLHYFLVIPRLQRLYKSSHTVKEMTWHATGKCTELVLQHVPDDTWLCMKESSFMLTLLIPGPKSPGKDIDVYLRPLIDDLKDLWAKPGVETIDVATGQKFNMRAMIRQRHVDKDPGVSASSELFALACGPTPSPISVNSWVLKNGVRFVVHSRDELRTTQNNGICLPVVNQSMFDAPPDIIDVDEDDDIIDDKDVLPYDLADSDDEDLVNVDDGDGVAQVVVMGVMRDDVTTKSVSRASCRWLNDCQDGIPPKENMELGVKEINSMIRPAAYRSEWKMQSSATQEYPSLIQTFFDTHIVGGVFLQDEDRHLYEKMLRLQGLGTYIDDQIMAIIHGGKQRGYILGVGKVLAGRGKDVLDVPVPRCNHTSDVNELKRSNKQLQKQIGMITTAMSSDDRMS